MKLKFYLGIAALLSTALSAQLSIFNDSFADGNAAMTGTTDTNWYDTTNNNAYEISTGVLGLISGTAGRGIHTTFSAQSLSNVGDSIRFSFTFSTPATILGDTTKPSGFKFGLFNSGGQTVNEDVTDSTDARWNNVLGYMTDLDASTDDNEDINFRESLTLRTTSRLLGSTNDFSSLTSGPDGAYKFAANTDYSVSLTIELTGADELTLTGTVYDSADTVIATHNDTTAAGITTFDLAAIHVNSNVFGSTSSTGVADNGIDITNASLTLTAVVIPEPSFYAALAGLLALGLVVYRRRS